MAGAADGSHEAGAIGVAVVGEDALDRDAAAGEPGQGSAQKAYDRDAALVGQNLGVRDTRTVIDADMNEFPADASRAEAAIPADPMADLTDAPELLRIQVQQAARAPPTRSAGLPAAVRGRPSGSARAAAASVLPWPGSRRRSRRSARSSRASARRKRSISTMRPVEMARGE
jgi:hypothetical protein